MQYPRANIYPYRSPDDSHMYVLAGEFVSAQAHGGIEVPLGFLYDGASVPRIAWSLTDILPDGKNREAALIHDWIYVNKGNIEEGFTRKEADKLFKKMLKDYGVSSFKTWLCYTAVRIGGKKVWREGSGIPKIVKV